MTAQMSWVKEEFHVYLFTFILGTVWLWLGRSPGEGNGNPLQYSCLENPMEGGAW